MKTIHQNKLNIKYPKIFSEYVEDPVITNMKFGIECGDGWYDIIDKCCERIQEVCDSTPPLQVIASQIKEKYGTLRFYIDFAVSRNSSIIPDNLIDIESRPDTEETNYMVASDIIYKIIKEAELESASCCEVCGHNGRLCQYGGWYHTLCRECAYNSHYIPVPITEEVN